MSCLITGASLENWTRSFRIAWRQIMFLSRRNRAQRVPGDITPSYTFSRVARLNAVIKHFITWPLSVGNFVSTLMRRDRRARAGHPPKKGSTIKKFFFYFFESEQETRNTSENATYFLISQCFIFATKPSECMAGRLFPWPAPVILYRHTSSMLSFSMRLRKRGRTGHVITYDITPLLRIFALVTISICVVHQAGKMALGLILLISWPLSVACAARWERSSYVSVFVSSGKLQTDY